MFDRKEIIEMITRQYNVSESAKKYVQNKISVTSDTEELIREFNKASLGSKLMPCGYNRFQITF
jgi:hypothetical protein